jgi:hypothetical protein
MDLVSRRIVGLTVTLIVILVSSIGLFVLTLNQTRSAVYQARDYAIQKGIPNDLKMDTLDQTWFADNGTKERAIIDYASQLDTIRQEIFLNAVLVANDTIAMYHQVQFLISLPIDEQQKIIDVGNSANFDLNGDGMNNYFEHNVASLSYADQPTERWSLIVNTFNVSTDIRNGKEVESFSGIKLANFLINEEHFKPDHVTNLEYTNATSTNFNKAIDNLSIKVGPNDIVFISLFGHGNEGLFGFNDGQGENQEYTGENNLLYYTDFAHQLDKLHAGKILVIIKACNAASAVSILVGGANRVVADLDDFYVRAISAYCLPSLDYHAPITVNGKGNTYVNEDLDGNGYVSVGEILNFRNTCLVGWTENYYNATISDKSDIASNFYLGDFNIKDQT